MSSILQCRHKLQSRRPVPAAAIIAFDAASGWVEQPAVEGAPDAPVDKPAADAQVST
jgi:hypothetical protein